jgi:hypothetical protein
VQFNDHALRGDWHLPAKNIWNTARLTVFGNSNLSGGIDRTWYKDKAKILCKEKTTSATSTSITSFSSNENPKCVIVFFNKGCIQNNYHNCNIDRYSLK